MEFIIAESTEDMSRQAADRIASYVDADPSCVLGLATGTTPIGLYACLVEDCAAGKISFADVTTFNLDEYRGLDPEHDQSYRYFMKKHLFDHVDIDQARTHVPERRRTPTPTPMCAAYEAGHRSRRAASTCSCSASATNGHIGFNEPERHVPCDHALRRPHREHHPGQQPPVPSSIDEVPRQALHHGHRHHHGRAQRAAWW